MSDRPSTLAKLAIAAALLLVGTAGLAMTVCGAVVTATDIVHSQKPGTGFLMISIPSLVVGVSVLYFAVWAWKRAFLQKRP